MKYLPLFEERLKGVSPFTKKNYLVYIRLLDKRIKEAKKDNAELTNKELYEFMNKIIEGYRLKKNRGGMMARAAFIKLLRYLDVPRSEADDALIKAKEYERKIAKKWVTFGVLKKIIEGTTNDKLRLNIMVQYETCSRIEDILALKVENIDFDDEVIRMQTLKTGISKVNAITAHTLQMLKKEVFGKKPNEIVFTMKYWDVWNEERLLVQRLKKKGVISADDARFSSHWLRASRAVHLYKKGADLEAIQREGGWKNIESLLRYLKMAGLDTKKIREKYPVVWN